MFTRSARKEVLFVFLIITALTVAIDHLRHTPLREYVHLMVGLLFLVTAYRLAQREPDGIERHGIALGGLLSPPHTAPEPGLAGAIGDLARALLAAVPVALRELLVSFAVACVVFPPFAVAFYLWHAPDHAFTWHWPHALPAQLSTQLLVVALPEEALFRGYVQTRLTDAFPEQRPLLGVRLSWTAWLIQALLFALIHFATDLHWARLAVFFPALLFGWLRAWRGGIGAAIVLHALSNLLAEILARGWS